MILYLNIYLQIQALWSKKACEIVIAVTQSNDKKRSYILHHSELKTLQPHKWLVGEVRNENIKKKHTLYNALVLRLLKNVL